MKLVGKIFLFPVLYNFIFPVRLVVFPYVAELILGASLLYFIGVVSISGCSRLIARREVVRLICAWVVLFAVAFFSVVINGTYDFGMVVVLCNYIFTLLYALFFAASLASGGFGKVRGGQSVIRIVVACCVLIALSVYLDVFIPAAKNFFLAYIYKSGNIDYEDSFRASGLSVSGGAALSFALALGCGLSLLVAVTAVRSWDRLVFYSAGLFLLCSTIFVGRSGVVFALVFTLASLRHVSLGRFAYLATAIIGMALIGSFFLPMLSDDASTYFSHHVLEVVDNYRNHGKIESSTTDAVESMYFLPRIENLIYGAGFLNEASGGYILPDPGYMKVLLAFGVFGAVLFYMVAFRLVRGCYRYLRRTFDGGGVIILAMMLSYFIFEFKEPAFYQNYEFRILILCFSMAVVQRAVDAQSRRFVEQQGVLDSPPIASEVAQG